MLGHLLVAILALGAADRPPVERVRAAVSRPALTRAQAAGQHVVLAYDGLRPPAGLRARIARGEAAGVILFARNVRSLGQLRATVRGLQAIRRPPGLRAPLLVMVDQEGGPVRRLPGAPERAAYGVSGAAQAHADGAAAAATLRRGGANVNLAPVADVARAGAAIERERRTFAGGPARVARLAGAFAAGLREGGIAATAKHFPGFGAAALNTDVAAQRVETSLDELREVDGAPFQRLIDAGVDAVMLSTAVYPALDPLPAALSEAWIGGELRGRLGFRGVTISDDLATPALAGYGSTARRAVLAVRAGIDLPLVTASYAASARAADGLLAATGRGELDPRALRVSARRVLRLRARLASR